MLHLCSVVLRSSPPPEVDEPIATKKKKLQERKDHNSNSKEKHNRWNQERKQCQEIRMRIAQLNDDALESLKAKVRAHGKENEEKYGLDSEEFDNWQILRDKIRELLN